MILELALLKKMHPLLPATTAFEYAHRAAVGLQRHCHNPGVALATTVLNNGAGQASLTWIPCSLLDADQIDYNRVTEDAAEAVALALVYTALGWVVRRRLQRFESADWLLLDPNRNHVALEVSGIDKADNGGRLLKKQQQVRRAIVASNRVACVVELATPSATVASA